jgi:hypothetical protein
MLDDIARLTQISNNFCKITIDGTFHVWISYRTIIGFQHREVRGFLAGSWSHTTRRHFAQIRPNQDEYLPTKAFQLKMAEEAHDAFKASSTYLKTLIAHLKGAEKKERAEALRQKKEAEEFKKKESTRKRVEKAQTKVSLQEYLDGLDEDGKTIATRLREFTGGTTEAWKLLSRELPAIDISRVKEIREKLKGFGL